MIKISIIILCYNVEKFIERALLSAINQTMKEIEILVINDGSTDNTLKIIKKYSYDKRIRIIDKKNEGVAKTRNRGIKEARGEYVQFLDGDDYLELDTCEIAYNYAKKNNLDIVCYDILREINDKKIAMRTLVEMKEEKDYSTEEVLKMLNKSQSDITNVAKLIKRELYKENEIFYYENISLGEDLFVFLKLVLRSKKIGKVNKAFYHYIFNQTSLTNTKKGERIYDIILGFKQFEKDEKDIKYREELGKIKALFLSSYLYTKPLYENNKYLMGVEEFLKYVKTELKFSEINSLILKRKLLYYFIKLFPCKKSLYIIASICNYCITKVKK